jgi:hypothetical protein
MKLLVWNFSRMLRLIFKRKSSVSTGPVELEMGLPHHHLVEIKLAQINVETSKPPTTQNHFNYI